MYIYIYIYVYRERERVREILICIIIKLVVWICVRIILFCAIRAEDDGGAGQAPGDAPPSKRNKEFGRDWHYINTNVNTNSSFTNSIVNHAITTDISVDYYYV